MNPNHPGLLKLAEYNTRVRETFEIIEDTTLEYAPQYFIMYIMEEGEHFNPEHIVGFQTEQAVATAMAYFRSTGILRWEEHHYWQRDPDRFTEVQPIALFILRTEGIMRKVKRFEHEQVLQEDPT